MIENGSKIKENRISAAECGKVRIVFGRPISGRGNIFGLILALGSKQGNKLLVENGKVIGTVCHPDDWRALIKSFGAPLEEFEAILAEVYPNTTNVARARQGREH
jgi:hypothetical protein